jgi:hypothetical protein
MNRKLAAAIVALSVVAGLPGARGVGASTDDRDVSAALVCSGSLNLAITQVDGMAVRSTRSVGWSEPPTQSSFSFSHTFTVHNSGSVAARTMSFVALPGRNDSGPLSGRLLVGVAVSSNDFVTSTNAPTTSLAGLETQSRRPVALAVVVRPGADLRVRLTFSAADLDDSFQGASVRPSLTFVFAG